MENNAEVTVRKVTFDVTYDYYEELDPLGTGDSPTSYTVDIGKIEIAGMDVTDMIHQSVVDEIEEELIEIERGY